MGVPLANGAVKTMRTNVVGRGLRLKSTIDAETLGISPEERRNLEKKIEKSGLSGLKAMIAICQG